MMLLRLFIVGVVLLFQQGSYALKVNVLDQYGFSQIQKQKLSDAVVVLNQILNSAEFKERVLNFKYLDKNQFVQSNGLTNEGVYNLIMSGAEKYPKASAANELMDIYLAIYYPRWWRSRSSAIGLYVSI